MKKTSFKVIGRPETGWKSKSPEISLTARECDGSLRKLGGSDSGVQDFRGRTKYKERVA